jgi:hypothetical protein
LNQIFFLSFSICRTGDGEMVVTAEEVAVVAMEWAGAHAMGLGSG